MSASTKLPTPSGSVGTWGAELNDFLSQSMVASTTAGADNGKLTEDHAAITRGGKVGIGTNAPTARLEVASQGTTTISTRLNGLVVVSGSTDGCTFNYGANENTYIRGGKSTSNVYIGDQSLATVNISNELPKPGIPDVSINVGGTATESGQVKVVGQFPSLTFSDGGAFSHIATDNAGTIGIYTFSSSIKLNTTTETPKLVVDPYGKVGIGTKTPTAKFQVVGLIDYASDTAAGAAGLTTGAFYHTTGTLKIKL